MYSSSIHDSNQTLEVSRYHAQLSSQHLMRKARDHFAFSVGLLSPLPVYIIALRTWRLCIRLSPL